MAKEKIFESETPEVEIVNGKLKVIHKPLKVSASAYKHDSIIDDTKDNRNAILQDSKSKGYRVKFDQRGDLTVVWIGY